MIVVVGAGLAGLSCALELKRLGLPFTVLEAGDGPGGRVRSIVRDGFTLDRGFQVMLSSYSAVREAVDIPSLHPRFFESGAILAGKDGRIVHLANPLRHPLELAGTLSAFSLPDQFRLAVLGGRTMLRRDRELLALCGRKDDLPTLQFLQQQGFSEDFISRFAVPFFGGVLLDEGLSTSAGLFLYYLKKFATGRAWIPSAGIGAFPRAMANKLGDGAIRFGCRVTGLEKMNSRASAIRLADGSTIPASAVILALDIPSLEILSGGSGVTPMQSVSVLYFRTRVPLYSSPCLVLPEGRGRMVRHFCQVTNIAPELAPPGCHLVSATVLGSAVNPEIEELVKREIAGIFPVARDMEFLEKMIIPQAVPVQPPGFAAAPLPPGLDANVFVAGDSQGASIQNALESGIKAARAAAGSLV
ncbi:MAG: FAD-dependent oxidoreductase [Terrimicrobiaceae bacterium]